MDPAAQGHRAPLLGPRPAPTRYVYGTQRPMAAKEAVAHAKGWKTVRWRQGTKGWLTSRFVALRVQPSHGFVQGEPPHKEIWLLAERPEAEKAPTKYWLGDLPASTSLRRLVRVAKSRWAIEQDYQQLKDELGLDHYEGRGWIGWHHHLTLVMLAHAFLTLETLRRKKLLGGPCHRPAVSCSPCCAPGLGSVPIVAHRVRASVDHNYLT